MTIAKGAKFGPYEILAPLGAGGMGEVYRARDAKLGRDVAIKMLPASFAGDAERMARFEREAKVLASLDHPNIAAIYGVEDSGATLALVMQLAEGPTLADRIAQSPLLGDEALKIVRQIAEALEYAHERGIVHRDLKPANIKISRDDAVKILDFGLAKAVEREASSMDMANSPTLTHMATMQGVLLGTAAYMSPEQAKAKPVDRRADIWAFGCVVYEMLTGKMAFDGETTSDTLAAVIRGEPDWSLLPANTPARIRVLLQRCLQKDAKQRLQAIGEARIAIDAVLAGAPDATTATAAPIPTPFWRRALPWAVACVAVAAAIALGLLYVREKPAAPAGEVRFQIPVPAKLTPDGVFAVSPDGREFAFFATGADGATRIYLRSLDSLDARPLPGTESTAEDPALWWSPDGKRIAFSTAGKIEAIDVASGAADTLGETQLFVAGGSFSRDGGVVFGEYPGPLMRVSAVNGTVSPLTALDSSRNEAAHFLPSFLPDGRHFIYLRFSFHLANSGTYVGSLDAQPPKQDLDRLVATDFGAAYVPSFSDSNAGYLLFLKGGLDGGTLMAQPFDARRLKVTREPVQLAQHVGTFSVFGFFSAAADTLVYRQAAGGDYRLTWYDRQGKSVGTVGEPAPYGQPAISPDGSRAIVIRPDSQGGLALWVVDFSRGTSTRFTFGSASAGVGGAIWSPDGRSVFFDSNPEGVNDLYEKPANGEAGEQLVLKSNEDKVPLDVSPDGRFLLYNSLDPKTKGDLWILPLQGDRKPFPFLRTTFNEDDGRFSPDGHWVAFTSDESGSTEVYVRPFSPDSGATDASGAGAKWQISYGGGEAPRWSKDGKELYYLTSDWKVMAVAILASPSFQAGTPKLLFQAPQQQSNWPIDGYTIDGKRFLFFTAVESGGQAQAPFNVVLNWQAALKQSQ